MKTVLNSSLDFLESIKFSHTIFALPFSLIALFLANRGQLPNLQDSSYVILAMVGARTWAMGINRVVDWRIDALNPRTATRAIPAGKMSAARMLGYSFLGAFVFVFAAFRLSFTAGVCSFAVLAILASYSYTKRFTYFCHFWLGLCLSLAPLGAWVALTGTIRGDILLLSAGIVFWVGGFDILYSLQDENFDRSQKLHSIPAKFGSKKALKIAQTSHVLAALLFIAFGLAFSLGSIYFFGIFFASVLMIYEHLLVVRHGLNKIDFAFFNLNGWIAVLLLFATAAHLYFE